MLSIFTKYKIKNNINSFNNIYNFLSTIIVALIVSKRYGDILVDNTIFSSPSKYILLIIMLISIINIYLNYKRLKISDIIIAYVLLIQFIVTKNGVLLFSYISILGIKYHNINKTIKIYFITNLLFFIVIIILNKANLKPSLIIKTYDDLGFGNPNTAYISFYLIWLSYLYLRFNKTNYIEKILLITTPIIMYSITHSRTGLVTILFTIAFSLFLKYINFEDDSKKNKFILIILSSIPIIITIISLVIGYKFNENTLLNNVLSTRPLCWNRYLKHPDKPLNLIGYDNNIRHTLMGGAIPLDSGYISNIYINGVIIYALFIILYSYTIYLTYKNKKKKNLVLIMSILMYSFAESITLDLSTNISLILLIQNQDYYTSFKKSVNSNKKI